MNWKEILLAQYLYLKTVVSEKKKNITEAKDCLQIVFPAL